MKKKSIRNTLDENVAMAKRLGISYGKFVAHIKGKTNFHYDDAATHFRSKPVNSINRHVNMELIYF